MNRRNNLTIGVCTRNRPKKCLSLLRTISKNRAAINSIVIIEDISDQQYLSKELIKKIFENNNQIKIIYKSVKYQNVAQSRNLVLDTAKSKFLIFIDDDISLTKNSIQKTINVLSQSEKNTIVIGLLKPKIKNLISLADYVYYNRERPSYKHKYLEMVPFSFVGLNLNVIKNQQIRFDHKFDKPAGEDIDFCLQINKEELRIVYDSSIINYHFFDTNLTNFLRKKYGYGPYIYYLCQKYPEQIFLSYYIPTRKMWKLLPCLGIFLRSIKTFSYSKSVKMPFISRIILFLAEYTVNQSIYRYFLLEKSK